MNKKGQFYIIIVLVICMALYGITRDENTVKEATLFEDFSKVSSNYINEAPKVINYAIYNDESVEDTLTGFTTKFLKYAEKRGGNIGLVYVFYDSTTNNEAIITNYLREGITDSENVILGQQQDVLESITVNVGGKDFYHQVPVKALNFGESWYSSSNLNPGLITLSIGGILHNIDLEDTNGPTFKVILKTESGAEETKTIGEGTSGEFNPMYSPDKDDLSSKVVEVKTN